MLKHFTAREAVQSLLALLVIVVISALYLTNRDVPKELIGLVSLVLGFYFKQSVNGVHNALNKES